MPWVETAIGATALALAFFGLLSLFRTPRERRPGVLAVVGIFLTAAAIAFK